MKPPAYLLAIAFTLGCGCKAEVEQPAARDVAAERDEVELDKRVVEQSGIRWTKAERRQLARTISAPSEVEFDPDRTAHVAPLTDARIVRVSCKVGDRVARGAALAVLSSVAGAESRAGLTQAQADLELARSNLERQQQLHASGIDTERVHQEAAAALVRAQAQLQAAQQRAGLTGGLTLRSPLAGTIVARHATVGETVGPDAKLFTIADLSRVWVVGRVYERDVGAVRAGSAARLVLEAYPDRWWDGHLVYVAGALDHESRTLPVRMELDNAEGALRPGLFGTVTIEAGDVVQALAVESDAIQRIGSRAIAFVRQPPHGAVETFAVRELDIGRTFGAYVEVKAGVQAGEEVVTAGGFTLKGQLLRDTLAEDE